MPLPDLPAWLAEPWAHSGLVPFVAGLVVAELLNRVRLSGLAVLAGLLCTAQFVLAPASRYALDAAPGRIIVVCLAGACAGLLFDLVAPLRWLLRPMAVVAAGIAVCWAGAAALAAMPLAGMIGLGGLAAAFAAWAAFVAASVVSTPERTASLGAGMGVAAGLCAVAGTPGPLGSLALAAGAASGAHLLIQMLSNRRLPGGSILALSVALSAALLPAAAMLAGSIPWAVLLVLATVPAAALVPVPEHVAVSLRSLLLLAACALAGGAAVALAHFGPQ